jgi:hypothetical protein
MNTAAAIFVPNKHRERPTIIFACATGCLGGTVCNCVTFLHVPSPTCSCETCCAFAAKWSAASPPASPAGAVPAGHCAATAVLVLPVSTPKQCTSCEDHIARSPHAGPLCDACRHGGGPATGSCCCDTCEFEASDFCDSGDSDSDSGDADSCYSDYSCSYSGDSDSCYTVNPSCSACLDEFDQSNWTSDYAGPFVSTFCDLCLHAAGYSLEMQSCEGTEYEEPEDWVLALISPGGAIRYDSDSDRFESDSD